MLTKCLAVLLIFVFVFGSILPTPPVSAQIEASTGWEAAGQAGGPTQGIAVQGNYAYIGVGLGLVVVDISDPANPHQVGATAMLDDFVLGVTVSGTLAYLAAGTAGLLIVDISSPSNPFVVGVWNSPGYAEGVTVSDSTAFLADGPYGLRVVDVSNPAVPVEIAHAFDMNYTYAVAVSGRYAYVAAGGAGLLVVEISNPAYPVEVGAYDTPGNARGLAVQNGRAYVADERYGLHIVNVFDPLHPALLGTVQTYGWVFDVAVSGSLAYVADAFGGLRLVNISDPAHPLEVGSLVLAQSNVTGLVLVGDHVYLADRKNGLRVVNASNPTNLVQIGYWNCFVFAASIEVEGDYAYVAAGFNGVRVYNISNPSHPIEVGSFMVDGFILNIKLAGNTLYAGTFLGSPEAGLYALDISDPTHLHMVGYYANIEECWGIDVDGSMVYVADVSGLKIFDFSNPPDLNLVGFYPYTGTGGITVRDSLAYVSEGSGVEIYNVADPASITLVGSFTCSTCFAGGPVSLAGNYAYVSENWGLRILNISNPASPTEVSYTPTRQETTWLALNGSQVVMAEGSYGFSVYDVSNPAAPQLINQIPVVGSVQAVALSAGRLFTASGEGGLQVFTETAVSGLIQPVLQSQGVWEEQTMLINSPGRQVPTPNLAADIPVIPSAPDRPATTCTVTSAADSGSGTLRACLENQVSGDVIIFSDSVFPPAAPVTIHVGPERLPWLDQGNITIDASNAGVILDGSLVLGAWDPGIGMNSNNNTVRGLQILNFPSGIGVMGNNNRIGGSRQVGSGLTGQGNVISGNRGDGIALGGYGNIILGNLIGLDVTGTNAFPNHWSGVTFNGPDNTLGSLNPGEDNVISANEDAGITMYGYNVAGNQIIGNKIGTDITGNVNLGNKIIGVYVECGANNTLVHGNLISSNGVAEIYVWDMNTDFNVLTGNRISTNLAGTAPLPNLPSVAIAIGSAAYTRIGGTAVGEGNTVGNPGGVSVEGPLDANTLVLGNHIGLNAAGTAVLAGSGGLRLGGATRTIVGGVTPTEANYITGGGFSLDVRSANNVIAGNFMGLAIDGVTPLATAGFQILSMRDGNVIQGNHIANATSAGIWLEGGQTNTIRHNSIYANSWKGIFLNIDANSNLPAPGFSLSAAGGSGKTCPGCTVELFLDENNQGRFYLEDVVADDTGALEFPALCPLLYPNLTATATDLQGNTSEFSDPQAVSWDCNTERPIPSLVSLDPTSQPALAPTFLLTITGTSFYTDSVVRWDGIPLPTTVLSSTLAQAVIPSYLFQQGGDFPVTVFTPVPGGGVSGALVVSIAPPVRVNLPIIFRK